MIWTTPKKRTKMLVTRNGDLLTSVWQLVEKQTETEEAEWNAASFKAIICTCAHLSNFQGKGLRQE